MTAYESHIINTRGRVEPIGLESEVQSAWDAALCAVQARCFDEAGNLKSAGEIMSVLTSLHTWNKEDAP